MSICPDRLARALVLDVEPMDAGDAYRVTGGREAHVVRRLHRRVLEALRQAVGAG